MKTHKAFIRFDGEVDLKELPSIEVMDDQFIEKLEQRRREFNQMLKNPDSRHSLNRKESEKVPEQSEENRTE